MIDRRSQVQSILLTPAMVGVAKKHGFKPLTERDAVKLAAWEADNEALEPPKIKLKDTNILTGDL